jgi:hypothetical protein
MSKTKEKSKLIEALVIECRADGEKVFDNLNERTPQYLRKLLKVAQNAL